MVTQTITLSMIPGGVTPRIYASQNDHGLRVFVFNLVDENGGYAIPSGTTALLNVLKPDRTVVSETCTWSGSTVTADCTEQMTAVAGNVHCEVRLVAANGDAVGSANFILGVETNPLASGVVSESDFDSISDMVDRAVAAASIPPTYVTDWLEDNITQETGYVLDKSLTIENAAADAKAAGDLIRAAFVVGEASGSIASFTDGADSVPVQDLVVNIQPKQSGTGDPSPSNVRAISGWTGATISRTGKNLLDISYNTNDTINGVTFTNNADGTITVNGTATAVTNYVIAKTTKSGLIERGFLALAGVTVNLSGCPSGGSGTTYQMQAAGFGTRPGSTSKNANDNGDGVTYRIDDFSNASVTMYIRIHLGNGTVCNNLVFKPMIAVVDADQTFEPYNGNTYNVSFGSSAGTVYGGTLDVTSGMLTVTDIGISLDALTWEYVSNYNFFRTVAQIEELPSAVALGRTDGICSIYPVTTLAYPVNKDKVLSYCNLTYGNTKKIIIVDQNYSSATLSDFVSQLAGQKLVCKLAQPVSVQLDAVTIKTLLGNNNIWSDTGSVASCEYRADTKLYIEKLTNPDDDMVANANITSGSYFMTGNTLYKATANIANGATIIPGTNCTRKSLAEALNEINA